MDCILISTIWEDIDLSESYLVHCMFEEAVKLSSLIIHRLRNGPVEEGIHDEWANVLESAGMVFIQSMRGLGRMQELFVELKVLFGSIASIPVQVLLTGACMTLTEQPLPDLKDVFEEFLTKWNYRNGEYTLVEEEQVDSSNVIQLNMPAAQYVEVADFYAVTLLGRVLNNPDVALSWVDKAVLPEESRLNTLSRLHSLFRLAESNLSSSTSLEQVNSSISTCGTSPTSSSYDSYHKDAKPQIWSNNSNLEKDPLKSQHPNIQRMMNQIEPCFWWYRTVRMKYANIQLVTSQRKLMLVTSLMIVALYVLRNKSTILKRFAAKQASSLKRALIDAWQLAFSVQVNPLAAIQQAPSLPHGSR